jgi:ribonuclease-3
MLLRQTPLERKLKQRFKDRRLLEQALSHPSYLNEISPGGGTIDSYERLEFLGDAVVGMAVTQELFARYPDLPEGQLTKLRSSLVSGKTLARTARGLELGQHLKLGRGEQSSGGSDRDSNLAAAFEALIGAVFLDRGFDAAKKMVLRLLAGEMAGLLEGGVPEDPKSRLQEVIQRMGKPLPEYRLVDSGGPDHDRSFGVEVLMDGQVMGSGRGKRKLDAEKQAAQEALRRLGPPYDKRSSE